MLAACLSFTPTFCVFFLHSSRMLFICARACVNYDDLDAHPCHPIPEFRSPSHGGNLNRSASISCSERGGAAESGSMGGSNSQIAATLFQYVPDFCVRALSDLQFVKVG